MTKAEAEKRGKALLKKLRGDGWKLDIWENLGWHYAASNGPLSVYGPEKKEETFCCLMSDNPNKAHAGAGIWHLERNYSRDPNLVITRQVKEARKVLDQLTKAVRKAERICSYGG